MADGGDLALFLLWEEGPPPPERPGGPREKGAACRRCAGGNGAVRMRLTKLCEPPVSALRLAHAATAMAREKLPRDLLVAVLTRCAIMALSCRSFCNLGLVKLPVM